MRISSHPRGQEPPEQRLGRLAARLRNHVLWDALLIFSPPLLVSIYLAAYLYRAAWIAQPTLALFSIAIIGAVLIAVIARYRPLMPSLPYAARLVDEKSKAQDRFLTLATIEAALWPPALIERVRSEAAALLDRIDFKIEFPYRVKRSFYWSLAASVFIALIFHLWLALPGPRVGRTSPDEQVRQLAEKMALRPNLSALSRNLQVLAAKLRDPSVPDREKQTSIQQSLEEVEEQQKKEQDQKNRELLGETSSTLRGLEQQSSGTQEREAEKGGGDIQSNLPQEGQGEGKQSQGNGGDSQSEINPQPSKDMQQGKTAGGDPKQQGVEKSQQNQGEGKNNQPNPSKSEQSPGTEEKTQGGGGQERSAKSRSDEIPQGPPPPERFHKPGEEGQGGIKGAGYVTVQLPEEIAGDAQGQGTTTKESKSTKARAKVPVSNVPLPAHVPDAPAEKQQLPLEYRGIIR
jgi:hypothetical protein